MAVTFIDLLQDLQSTFRAYFAVNNPEFFKLLGELSLEYVDNDLDGALIHGVPYHDE